MSICHPRPQDCIRLDTTIELYEFAQTLRNDMCLDTESYQEISRDTFNGYAEMAFNALAKGGVEKVTLTLYRIPAEEARFKFIDGTCDGPEEGFSDL